MTKGKKIVKYEIIVGLNDKDKHIKAYDDVFYEKVLNSVFNNYDVSCSIGFLYGRYKHNSGKVIQETSLSIQIINADDTLIEEIAKDICVFFNQESVIINKSELESYTISESL